MTQNLRRITLTTGRVTQVARRDIRDDAIAAIAEMLDGVLLGGLLPAPGGSDGYLVDGSHHRDNLMVTLWRGSRAQRMPILTTAVARGPGPALTLWREMHRSAQVSLATDTGSPPPEPWIADRPEPGSLLLADTPAWIENWSRGLGWAWMEYGR